MKPARTTLGVPTVLACLVASACGSGGPIEPAVQGIEGIALLGPQCPVQTEEDPCPDLPYQAWVSVRAPSGRLHTRFRTGEDGRFRVGLPAGRYTLDPDSGNPFPIAGDLDVEVVSGGYTSVVIQFDTGIR